MVKNLYLFFSLLLSLICTVSAQPKTARLIDFVNPFIGTGAVDAHSLSGNNFPGATTPFGFVQLSPDTQNEPYSPCSGYDYYDSTIYGFSHTHLSGTGISDLFDVLVMPFNERKTTATIAATSANQHRSRFSHKEEGARPGYYRVNLQDYNINAELTATEHAGFHRYTFPQSTQSHILIDMNHSLDKTRTWWACKILSAEMNVVNNQTVEGYRIITGWGKGFRKVYFTAQFSKPFTGHTAMSGDTAFKNKGTVNGKALKMILDFNTSANEQVLLKVGLSAVSIENARANLSAEIPQWNFDAITQKAASQWEAELQKILIDGTDEQKQIFYTGLYHAFIQPNNIADGNGDYTALDKQLNAAAGGKQYSTFSLWDTYRAAHPLYTLTQPKLTGHFISSMVRQADAYGILPIWQLWGLENNCMIGNHAIPVIVDAVLKNMRGFDVEMAYKAVIASSTKNHSNSPFTNWEKYGYVPEDVNSQSVSLTLEIAYDDWCVAQFAKKLGKKEDYLHYLKRSAFYKNLYDTKTNFFRAKNTSGSWIAPFDPLKYGGNGGSPYTEGNAWQYLFYVPQDVTGLIQLMGGKENFCKKLDTLFTLTDEHAAVNHNASGFIGQYAHGNEPSHHVAYLYNFAGQPWKAQKLVAQVLSEQYNNSFSGYSGNDDCGQMSAWYIFSAMGFYPVNPANGVYVIGTPILKTAEIKLENGATFKVLAKNVSAANRYIQSAKLNGKPYTKTFITQNTITAGGTLEFVMGNTPNTKWGTGVNDVPPAWGY